MDQGSEHQESMTDADTDHQVTPPFSPPPCQWIPMTSTSQVPEDALYLNGGLDGEKVYIGRVYDGKCIFIGTAIPSKNVCIYLDKNRELKSSSNYEILCVSDGDPLWFVEVKAAERNLFTSGIDEEEEILYTCRHIDEKFNTFYGWIDKMTKTAYIPRDLNRGPQVLDSGFEVLVHRYLHRMCTGCPMPVKGVHYFE